MKVNRELPTKLIIQIDTSDENLQDEWVATDEDLAKFGYVNQKVNYYVNQKVNYTFECLLEEMIDGEVTEHPINIIRYVVERIHYHNLPLDPNKYEEDKETLKEMKQLLDRMTLWKQIDEAAKGAKVVNEPVS